MRMLDMVGAYLVPGRDPYLVVPAGLPERANAQQTMKQRGGKAERGGRRRNSAVHRLRWRDSRDLIAFKGIFSSRGRI